MAYAHIPLEDDALAGAAKVVGAQAPEKLRGMAARGLVPLPPRELLLAVYQVWVTGGELGEIAGKTFAGLPDAVIESAVSDPSTHPGILDVIARKRAKDQVLLRRLVPLPNVSDDTLVLIARVGDEDTCDTLSDNQARWLEHPAIVETLYNNAACRMSTAHRMIELAMREGVPLKLANLDEIRQAMEDSGPVDADSDARFRSALSAEHERRRDAVAEEEATGAQRPEAEEDDEVAPDPHAEAREGLLVDLGDGADGSMNWLDELAGLDGEDVEGLDLSVVQASAAAKTSSAASEEEGVAARSLANLSMLRPIEKVRLATLGTDFERAVLVRDRNRTVAMAAIKSPKIKDSDAISLAANRTVCNDVIRYIAHKREWSKLYQVKLNLVSNPKTPISSALNFMSHIQRHDLQKLARSKNVPAAISQAAKRKLNGAKG